MVWLWLVVFRFIYGFVSKDMATKLLTGKPDGTFLLRFSESSIEASMKAEICGCITVAVTTRNPHTGESCHHTQPTHRWVMSPHAIHTTLVCLCVYLWDPDLFMSVLETLICLCVFMKPWSVHVCSWNSDVYICFCKTLKCSCMFMETWCVHVCSWNPEVFMCVHGNTVCSMYSWTP